MSAISLPLTLKPVDNISSEERATILESLGDNYSTIGTASNPEECLEYFEGKHGAWVIFSQEQPVGLTGLHRSSSRGEDYIQTSTYIFNKSRKMGYNNFLKRVMAQAFIHTPPFKMYCVIRDWNENARNSVESAFPDVKPILETRTEAQKLIDPVEHQWFYDFSKTHRRDILSMEKPIYNTITMWLNNQRKQLFKAA